MKQIRSLALPFLCCLLLCGCRGGGVLFFFEAPWYSLQGDDAHLRASFARAVLTQGMLPRFDVAPAGTDLRAGLEKALKDGRYKMAVVGPLLSFEWSGFARSYPGTRFVLVGAPAAESDPPPNVTFLTFDTRAAFRSAGREAAAAVTDRPVANPAQGIGVLVTRDSDLSADEIEAFLSGAEEGLGARPALRTLEPSADKSVVRTMIQELRGKGAEVFLLGLGSLAPAGLEALRDLGGRAVVAGWDGSGECPAQVLLSVEEDVPGGITAAIHAAASGEPRVSGVVNLVKGEASTPRTNGKGG